MKSSTEMLQILFCLLFLSQLHWSSSFQYRSRISVPIHIRVRSLSPLYLRSDDKNKRNRNEEDSDDNDSPRRSNKMSRDDFEDNDDEDNDIEDEIDRRMRNRFPGSGSNSGEGSSNRKKVPKSKTIVKDLNKWEVVNRAVLAGVFVAGIGSGITIDSAINTNPRDLASRDAIGNTNLISL